MVGIDGEDEKSNLPDNLNKFQVRELFTRTRVRTDPQKRNSIAFP